MTVSAAVPSAATGACPSAAPAGAIPRCLPRTQRRSPHAHASCLEARRSRADRCARAALQHRRRAACRCLASAAAVPTAAPGETKVGFLGIGIMGYAMANNLIKAGYDVTVWNRSPEKCKALAAAGAKVGATPAEVVAACDITLAMLSDPQACLAVATGPDGVASAIGAGKGYVDVSTVDAATSQQVAAAVRATGAAFLEAPVSGSKGPAEQGQLIFLTGGDKQLFDAASPLLEVMGKASFFLGEVGAGANMKLVVNMVMGTMLASYAEGLELAKQCGLKQSDLIEVVKLGAIASPMFALKAPAMVEGSYPPAFPLKHQQKDLRLALALGDAVAQPLPLAAAANELYKKARAAGYSDADFSAVMTAVTNPQTPASDAQQ